MPGTTRGRKAAPVKAVKPKAEDVIIAENAPEVPNGPATAAPEETPEQKRIRELEEKLASLLASQEKASDNVAVADEAPKDGDKIVIHFIEDGFTAQGQVWYRGQELEFEVGSPLWNETLNSGGNSWVLESENEQADKRGKIYFRRGPWQGKSYKDATWEKDAPDESALERADRLERERRRTAPRLPEIPTA